MLKSFLYLSYHHCGHLQDEATHETKYVQVKINTLTKVRMPSANNKMSIDQQKNWREGHEFVHMKHDTPYLLQWRWSYLEWSHAMQFILHYGNNDDDDPPLDLKDGH